MAMVKFQTGEVLQKSFLVGMQEITRFISGQTESSSPNHKLVAPNSLVNFYLESALEELIGLPPSGLFIEQQLRFANAVNVGDTIVVGMRISLWNPDAKLMRVSMQVNKSESNLPVCVGSVLLSLK